MSTSPNGLVLRQKVLDLSGKEIPWPSCNRESFQMYEAYVEGVKRLDPNDYTGISHMWKNIRDGFDIFDSRKNEVLESFTVLLMDCLESSMHGLSEQRSALLGGHDALEVVGAPTLGSTAVQLGYAVKLVAEATRLDPHLAWLFSAALKCWEFMIHTMEGMEISVRTRIRKLYDHVRDMRNDQWDMDRVTAPSMTEMAPTTPYQAAVTSMGTLDETSSNLSQGSGEGPVHNLMGMSVSKILEMCAQHNPLVAKVKGLDPKDYFGIESTWHDVKQSCLKGDALALESFIVLLNEIVRISEDGLSQDLSVVIGEDRPVRGQLRAPKVTWVNQREQLQYAKGLLLEAARLDPTRAWWFGAIWKSWCFMHAVADPLFARLGVGRRISMVYEEVQQMVMTQAITQSEHTATTPGSGTTARTRTVEAGSTMTSGATSTDTTPSTIPRDDEASADAINSMASSNPASTSVSQLRGSIKRWWRRRQRGTEG